MEPIIPNPEKDYVVGAPETDRQKLNTGVRKMVTKETFIQLYTETTSRDRKNAIADDLLERIVDNGGRLLKYSVESTSYIPVDKEAAMRQFKIYIKNLVSNFKQKSKVQAEMREKMSLIFTSKDQSLTAQSVGLNDNSTKPSTSLILTSKDQSVGLNVNVSDCTSKPSTSSKRPKIDFENISIIHNELCAMTARIFSPHFQFPLEDDKTLNDQLQKSNHFSFFAKSQSWSKGFSERSLTITVSKVDVEKCSSTHSKDIDKYLSNNLIDLYLELTARYVLG